jgi:hypothetical protein
MRFLILLLALLLPVLAGCPPTDDDDSAGDDDDSGTAPVVNNVSVCEVQNSSGCAAGPGSSFRLRWEANVSDADGDLLQPILQIAVGGPPFADCQYKADLGEGGVLECDRCEAWDRGTTIDWEVRVKDFERNPSEIVGGQFAVPADESETAGDCSPF